MTTARHSRGCQVPGCSNQLEGSFYQKFHCCRACANLPAVELGGQLLRFCQLCGRFHGLQDYDGDRKSCRVALARHNARRRKRRAEGAAAAACADSGPSRHSAHSAKAPRTAAGTEPSRLPSTSSSDPPSSAASLSVLPGADPPAQSASPSTASRPELPAAPGDPQAGGAPAALPPLFDLQLSVLKGGVLGGQPMRLAQQGYLPPVPAAAAAAAAGQGLTVRQASPVLAPGPAAGPSQQPALTLPLLPPPAQCHPAERWLPAEQALLQCQHAWGQAGEQGWLGLPASLPQGCPLPPAVAAACGPLHAAAGPALWPPPGLPPPGAAAHPAAAMACAAAAEQAPALKACPLAAAAAQAPAGPASTRAPFPALPPPQLGARQAIQALKGQAPRYEQQRQALKGQLERASQQFFGLPPEALAPGVRLGLLKLLVTDRAFARQLAVPEAASAEKEASRQQPAGSPQLTKSPDRQQAPNESAA